jgi:hypothetical protein
MSQNSRRRRERRDGSSEDRAWAGYTEAFRRDVLPALLDSAKLIMVHDDRDSLDGLDLRAATEMGLMLLLDKPLIIVVPRGGTVGGALRRAAAVVVEDFDADDPDAQDRMAAAIRSVRGIEP